MRNGTVSLGDCWGYVTEYRQILMGSSSRCHICDSKEADSRQYRIIYPTSILHIEYVGAGSVTWFMEFS